jgi:hypothetical protein
LSPDKDEKVHKYSISEHVDAVKHSIPMYFIEFGYQKHKQRLDYVENQQGLGHRIWEGIEQCSNEWAFEFARAIFYVRVTFHIDSTK